MEIEYGNLTCYCPGSIISLKFQIMLATEDLKCRCSIIILKTKTMLATEGFKCMININLQKVAENM